VNRAQNRQTTCKRRETNRLRLDDDEAGRDLTVFRPATITTWSRNRESIAQEAAVCSPRVFCFPKKKQR